MTNTIGVHFSDKDLEAFKRKFPNLKASKWLKAIVKK